VPPKSAEVQESTSAPRLRVDDFYYALPGAAIAQVPAEPRDASRLLLLDRRRSQAGIPALEHAAFRELGGWLRSGDLLVVNDSRVIPARLRGVRAGGGEAEVLLLRELAPLEWEGLVRPSRRIRVGDRLALASGDTVEVRGRAGDGTRILRFDRDPHAVMATSGEMPLPPYIHDRSSPPERYQTVYASPPGSAAAPTAGLHFTPELLDSLKAAGIRVTGLTLHVGLDTFRPLEGEFIDEHRIHTEWYEIPRDTAIAIAETRASGARVAAVGTTSVRVLESAVRGRSSPPATHASGWTDLYITPPYRFQVVDMLITNFHLPRSSLLLLVTAFVQAGMREATPFEARDTLLAAYAQALDAGYRFFSFGDAMLIA
jgi:S-adenosylmethionine:tRNA ribosyltransferase-isomerase